MMSDNWTNVSGLLAAEKAASGSKLTVEKCVRLTQSKVPISHVMLGPLIFSTKIECTHTCLSSAHNHNF